jgi:DNA-binding response OmpR family regulator
MPCDLATQPSIHAEASASQLSVLIVDDDTELADCLAYRLKSQGFETLTATTGADGLAQVRTRRPSLVLLDVGLPDADGLAICEELVDSPDTCHIPVIVISGTDGAQIVRRSRAAGCRYFLSKPCDPNALLLLIHQALREAEDWLVE